CGCNAVACLQLGTYQRTREYPNQAFGYCLAGEGRVAQRSMWQPTQHRGLNCGHHFARFGAKCGESKTTSIGLDQSFGDPARLREEPRGNVRHMSITFQREMPG